MQLDVAAVEQQLDARIEECALLNRRDRRKAIIFRTVMLLVGMCLVALSWTVLGCIVMLVGAWGIWRENFQYIGFTWGVPHMDDTLKRLRAAENPTGVAEELKRVITCGASYGPVDRAIEALAHWGGPDVLPFLKEAYTPTIHLNVEEADDPGCGHSSWWVADYEFPRSDKHLNFTVSLAFDGSRICEASQRGNILHKTTGSCATARDLHNAFQSAIAKLGGHPDLPLPPSPYEELFPARTPQT